jgi:hypothetical protein
LTSSGGCGKLRLMNDDCFCPREAHNESGCTTCRCNVVPNVRVKAKSCFDCPLMFIISGGSTPVIVIDDTGADSVDLEGDGPYKACSRGYWGGMMHHNPTGPRVVGRPPHGFLQNQAEICADFHDSTGDSCTDCRGPRGTEWRDGRAQLLCRHCARVWDDKNRRFRHGLAPEGGKTGPNLKPGGSV